MAAESDVPPTVATTTTAAASGTLAAGGTAKPPAPPLSAKALTNEIGALTKKLQDAEGRLQRTEESIYEMETEYLRETHLRGNVVKGWETFWRRTDKSANAPNARKLKAADRILSESSKTGAQGNDEGVLETTRSTKKNHSVHSGGIIKKKKLKKRASWDSD